MAILVSWLLCFIFTVTDVFPPKREQYGFYARTDARQGILTVAPWFKIPFPCKYALLSSAPLPSRPPPVDPLSSVSPVSSPVGPAHRHHGRRDWHDERCGG